MGQKLHNRIEIWKKLLLDFGKRNRLINFIESKRNNVTILSPTYSELYERIVSQEKEIVFPYAKTVSYDDSLTKYKQYTPIQYIKEYKKEEGNNADDIKAVVIEIPGNVTTNKSVVELEKTLKSLRYKANTFIEEQGINTLFLTFGMLKWREQDNSSQTLSSPLILVPVKLLIESLTSPYKLILHEDEIVVNPTLAHKLNNDFGINLPEFDSTCQSLDDFLNNIEKTVSNKGWKVENTIHLANLSFLKINMYKDLERNEDVLNENNVIAALVGEQDPIRISEELNDFDHDKRTRPIDTFQVVDADSSQQDAILLSKKGVSFVLQGPPGTGKSQTITNIIAEAMADGKKVLFVSEKMAALQVVYNRLSSVGLSDFCFTLHSHKAKKKDILRDLANSINIDHIRVREEALTQLDILERKRDELNRYQEELHTPTSGLKASIYNINGKLAKLEHVPDVIFSIGNIESITNEELNDKIYVLRELAKTIGEKSEDYSTNAWCHSSVKLLTNELRHDIDSNFILLIDQLILIDGIIEDICSQLKLNFNPSYNHINDLRNILETASKSPLIPYGWLNSNIEELKARAKENQDVIESIHGYKEKIYENYEEGILSINAEEVLSNVDECIANLNNFLQTFKFQELDEITSSLKDSLRTISELFNSANTVSEEFGLEYQKSFDGLKTINEISTILDLDIYPTSRWFDLKKFSGVKNNFISDKNAHENILTIKNKINSLYNVDILQCNIDDILERFQSQYIPFINQFSKEKLDITEPSSLSTLDLLADSLITFSDKITSTNKTIEKISEILNITNPISFVTLNELISFAQIVSKDIHPTERWFISSSYSELKQSFHDVIEKHHRINEYKNKILEAFDVDILSLDLYPMLQRFRCDYTSTLKRVFSSAYKRDIAELKRYMHTNKSMSYTNILEYLSLIKEYTDNINACNKDELLLNFGSYYTGCNTNWDDISEAFLVFDEALKYKRYMTNKFKNQWMLGQLDTDLLAREIEKFNETNLLDEFTNLNQYFSHKVNENLSLSIIKDELLTKYNNLNNFIKNIREDLDLIDKFAKTKKANSFIEYYRLIENISDLQQRIQAISKEEKNYKTYSSRYGVYYKGIETSWDTIELAINSFDALYSKFSRIPELLREKLLSNSYAKNNIRHFLDIYNECNIKDLYASIKKYLKYDINGDSELDKINKGCHEVVRNYEILKSQIETIITYRKDIASFESIYSDLKVLENLQLCEHSLLNDKESYTSLYGKYYQDLDTDWTSILGGLQFAEDFGDVINYYSLPNNFTEAICSDKNAVDYCASRFQDLANIQSQIEEPYRWFKSLFSDSSTFDDYNLKDIIVKLQNCVNKKYLLEEWVDYCSNKEKCKVLGLDEYVDQIEKVRINNDFIVDAYLKRFYRLWLDAILPQFPAVQNFRGRIHTQTISEFCTLDKAQFKIAQARVKERILSRIPDFDSINAARDEIAILKRELNKQRRLMPLRKLFMEIPNLLTSLRPCFMMSPLSVSVFLEAQSYNFDLVIFDEASQVHTEDAIGAIMRGKQVIIVGDTKQLPPTNFFSSSINDDDFDIDTEDVEEDNDAGAYESILEEAVSVLPERSLRWHYRSRHEHLIAFSNIKIYNSQLITFPSSIDKSDDNGVEYIYVKDGIYDRGKKKNNIQEAQKVADLVFEHFRKYPKRSLGVVTFSEAQQNAVDVAIRQKRLQNPSFDNFFIEDKEDPFFIKNLENVQGDERDTIIFSIGYAKDSKGIMYMNFGPLSREGGYRRLNVAITRAKYNIKLVGSIVPTDIDLDKVSSEGVKMLRSYIEFAQQGIVALEKDIKFNYDLDFDSPFEEAVYDFLQSKGYDVITQVGCSGFRIDMAVKSPTINGMFAIGIECDGATYHSSRTARERDRLRQTILEDMGWTIYRIWSTDWIKDSKTEGEKLIDAIETALGHKDAKKEMISMESFDNSYTIQTEDIEEKIEKISPEDSGYGFEYYNRNYPLRFTDNFGNIKRSQDIIIEVISLEQPIHFEELCRRLAPAYGRQKVTSVVRDEIKYNFSHLLQGIIDEDDENFITLKGFTDIKVRIPNPSDDYVRPVTSICRKELALAMKTIANHSFGITPEDLFVVTAREFGYKRTGENILSSFRKVYKLMLEEKEITEIDGKVHVI